MQEPLITRDMLMGDVVSKYPEAAQVMLEYGLHCVSCFANKLDTVEMGCKVHGMLEEEIQDLLNRVNDTIQKNSPNSPKV